MTPLSPDTVPLRGSGLIEASAGTGKTWTIATLFVRLVLTEDGPTGQPLQPEQILVLTFTRAATRELVDRIRRRLLECKALLAGEATPAEGDAFSAHLLQRFPSAAARQDAAWRLERAAVAMDGAAVTTIDAWVQRVLREHLPGTDALDLRQVVEDDAAWRRQAVRDYWRQQVYPLPQASADFVLEAFESPDELEAWLTPALRAAQDLPPPPDEPLAEALDHALAVRASRLADLKASWRGHLTEMDDWFAPRWAGAGKVLDGRRIKAAKVAQWADALRTWAESDSPVAFGVFDSEGTWDKSALRLLPDGLSDAHLAAFQPAPTPPWSQTLAGIAQELPALPDARDVMAMHALGWVHHRLHRLKRERGIWTFDDLLQHLEDRLAAESDLAPRLRGAYPAALIDEFQDTSARQLRVFDRIYDLASNNPATGLLLIGDPKQSIYRFRGADIHSYLQARRMTQGRHVGLLRNHRSTPALVEVVNRLFEQAEQRASPCADPSIGGAFRHGADVPFLPVQAVGVRERLVHQGRPQPVLVAWTEDQSLGGPAGRDRDARWAAHWLAHQLRDPHAGFEGPEGWRRLRPADFAILVRTGGEAAAMRRALQRQGIASAYLSERELVVHTQEARDVLDILQALHQPRDLSLARRAWATALMALPWSEQLEQATDEALWDQRVQRLLAWQQVWQRRGVLAAIRGFLQAEHVAARHLSSSTGGERALTNALHLAEWLQEVSLQVRSPETLMETLRRAILSEAERWRWPSGVQTHLLRLESEADLVRIVTLHKSKGLQYPIVMLPFASAVREDRRQRRKRPLVQIQGQWSAARSTGSSPPASGAAGDAGAAQDEALEEDRENIRLLYVGLTRAVHQLWLGAAPRAFKAQGDCQWHRSALGQLVSGLEERSPQEAMGDLRRWFGELSARGLNVRLDEGPDFRHLDVAARTDPSRTDPSRPDPQRAEPVQATSVQAPTIQAPAIGLPRPALRMSGPVDRSWRITSYSALVRDAEPEAHRPVPQPPERDRWDEGDIASFAAVHPAAPVQDEASAWHSLPSSAAFGEVLHALLEDSAAHGFAIDRDPALRRLLGRRLSASAWAQQEPLILDWLARVAAAPLAPWGVALQGLGAVRAELEFWMPLQPLLTSELDQLCRRHFWPGQPRPALQTQRLQGLLLGFADLVVAHGGQYGVIDFKSNRLGTGPDDYRADRLVTAVLNHRYDVQAAIYLLALHRLLRHRLGAAYRPAEHLGPAQFLFLRGVDHEDGGLLSIAPPLEGLNALDRLLGNPFPEQNQGPDGPAAATGSAAA